MGVDSNAALTLSEYAMQSNDDLVTSITYSLHKTGNLMQDIPLQTKETLVQNGVRFIDNLPAVNWRTLNQTPTGTKGKPTPWTEQLYVCSNLFQCDKKLVNEVNAIEDPMTTQVNAWMEAVAYDWNDKFFNNVHDGTGDNNAPVGLKARLANTEQYGTNSEMTINGLNATTIDMSAVTATTANDLIEGIQQLLDYMGEPDGNNVVLYMNDYLKRKFERSVRALGAGGGFDMTKDAFGRSVSMYRAAKVRDVGRKVDQTTRILGFETSTGTAWASANKYSSIFAVKYGKDSFTGWQYEPLKPVNLGLDPTNGVMYNTVVDWGVGLWQVHTRAVGRLYNIRIV